MCEFFYRNNNQLSIKTVNEETAAVLAAMGLTVSDAVRLLLELPANMPCPLRLRFRMRTIERSSAFKRDYKHEGKGPHRE